MLLTILGFMKPRKQQDSTMWEEEVKFYQLHSAMLSHRAFIQIQNGCDNKCTFCLTRLARGYSISTPSKQIIEQIKKLAHA